MIPLEDFIIQRRDFLKTSGKGYQHFLFPRHAQKCKGMWDGAMGSVWTFLSVGLLTFDGCITCGFHSAWCRRASFFRVLDCRIVGVPGWLDCVRNQAGRKVSAYLQQPWYVCWLFCPGCLVWLHKQNGDSQGTRQKLKITGTFFLDDKDWIAKLSWFPSTRMTLVSLMDLKTSWIITWWLPRCQVDGGKSTIICIPWDTVLCLALNCC